MTRPAMDSRIGPLTTRRWRLLPFALVVLVALPWAITPFVSAAAEKGSSAAAQLVEKTRDAPLTYNFEGVVELAWRDGKKMKRATVTVRGANGTIEVESAAGHVVDYGATTYVLGKSGWTSVGVTPTPVNLPSADHAWTLTTRAGADVAGRPTTTVVASRRATGVVQKLTIDTATGLLLARQVRSGGHLERSLQFTSLSVGAGPSAAKPERSSSNASSAVPDGFRAPREPGAGYVLVATKRAGGGVELSYSDGLFTVSIHEQRGALDWDSLPAGGTDFTFGGHQARRYTEPGDDVIVWERDGVVYTCVTDAPTAVVDSMIAGLAPSGRSAVEKAVDFVLGPFGWH
jgi:hypothetical protein